MGLLDRARNLLGGRSAPAPARVQYYHVACAEGHVLHGQRTDGYQALRCPTCGAGIFVLPRSPYPEPIAPASTSARRRAPVRTADDERIALADPPPPDEIARARSVDPPPPPDASTARIEWVDDDEPAPTPVAYTPETSLHADRVAAQAESPARPRSSDRRARRPSPATADVPDRVAVEPRPTLLEWAARRRNPLIFVGVLVVVLATVALRYRQARLDELPKVAELGRVQGLARLDAGDFSVAKRLLADASAAVDALGGEFEGADAIRQGAREAAVFADLVDETLESLIEKADRAGSDADWASTFATLYKGESIVLEARVSAVPDPARPGSAYDVDYRVYSGNGPAPKRRGRIDLTGFQLFEQSAPAVGEVKVFGARLATMRLDVDTGEFLFGLDPNSGVFITHYRALEALGWPSAEPGAGDGER